MAPQPLQKKSKKTKRIREDSEQIERIESLSWNPSLPDNDDPFSLFTGSNELEGGFLSLEEIDEIEYGLEIPKPERKSKREKSKETTKLQKRKRSQDHDESDGEAEAGSDEKFDEENKKVKAKKKREKKKKNKEKKSEENEEPAAAVTGASDCKDDIEGDSVDEAEYYAWNELRLHPLLLKSIYRLKFKEPTPIQKACIPAAAHQGKDVIGAAETGSGKTLAFGLPILQRLLEEREKADNLVAEKEEAVEKITPKGLLRALIITPTRELALQVTDHLKEVAKDTNIRVVPIVGGMSTEKQERLLKARPEIVVGTPGRLWELMSGGEVHLVELHSLSFFVLDEADRMIESGHFHELQSIIDMLPMTSSSHEGQPQNTQDCTTVVSFQRKKRQTFVFSATLALSSDFRKKLKKGSMKSKQIVNGELNSIETLSERAGMRANAAIVDLTNASIMADKLEESFIECREEDKDAYLYYILSVHGQGRTIVFCTSIAALRHTSSLLRILGINVWTLHAQMQQRARLKAIDRFRGNEHGILVATDVAARGLDIPGVRTVVHYQLPHSAEVYVHRSGRTARACTDGCSITLISPNDTSKFAALCKSFSKESFRRFPVEISYMSEVAKRLSLARQVDKILRKDSQDKAKKSWFDRNAESIELEVEDNDSEEERVNNCKQKKASSSHLKKLQQELNMLLSRPLQPKTFSHRFLAGAGVSPLLQNQFEELARQKLGDIMNSGEGKIGKLLVIGQDRVEPLQALRNANHEVMDLNEIVEKRRNVESLRRKRKEEKKRLHDQRRKQRKKLKAGTE
ncbi:DEAD-box ATP-dependent RNA helicase [Actinidia chinensis var. chinensis]|uniref:DEAD-box ATP-dependent RNA helicase n=1 Tax=Actinidia chinensis var. chinensis TaxID=1590841 RepID=A0A2R6R8Z0_ACTCC|nr:DEAD-box ATP-dependent RNA helicase [Actinidia chinensis var. chinensis]